MKKVNKESKQVLNKALRGLVDRLEKTEKFVLDQAPDICKQMVAEYKMDAFAGLAGSVLVTMIGIALITFAVHQGLFEVRYAGTSNEYTRSTEWMALYIFGIVASLASLIPMGINIRNLWFIANCPKLFLLRQFSELVK